jgi:CheY-like chemotaxis protein
MVMDTTKSKLLLVEDSEDDVYFFKRTLQKSGLTCAVHRVANGAEAIDFLRNTSTSSSAELPRVIFLDLKMPVLNGFEVLDWLQTQPFTPRMRVIVLSGSEHQNDKTRAAQMGATGYLVKPVTISDLNRFLRDVCPSNAEIGAPN